MAGRRILVLSGLQIFPPESGGMLRTSSLIAALVARGYDVTVYSMVGRKPDYLARRPSGTHTLNQRLREYVDRGRVWAALQFVAYRLGWPPLWITLALAVHTPRKLRELLASCDAVIADFPFLHPVAGATGKPVALNTHNVEADLWQRPFFKRLVANVERRAARRVRHVFCCSPGDRAFFSSIVGESRTSLVPNGIDLARFESLPTERIAMRAALGYRDDERVLLFAASSFGPNVEALSWLREFAAANRALLEERRLQFLVVGSVSKVPVELPRLKIVGPVARVEPYFAAADLAFNGVFRGSGTNIKMAEFIAAGLPILTSPAGMRGYTLVADEDCITFTPETLASVLANPVLLDDATRLAAMSRSAYEKNKHQIDMNWCIEPLITWVDQAVAPPTSPA